MDCRLHMSYLTILLLIFVHAIPMVGASLAKKSQLHALKIYLETQQFSDETTWSLNQATPEKKLEISLHSIRGGVVLEENADESSYLEYFKKEVHALVEKYRIDVRETFQKLQKNFPKMEKEFISNQTQKLPYEDDELDWEYKICDESLYRDEVRQKVRTLVEDMVQSSTSKKDILPNVATEEKEVKDLSLTKAEEKSENTFVETKESKTSGKRSKNSNKIMKPAFVEATNVDDSEMEWENVVLDSVHDTQEAIVPSERKEELQQKDERDGYDDFTVGDTDEESDSVIDKLSGTQNLDEEITQESIHEGDVQWEYTISDEEESMLDALLSPKRMGRSKEKKKTRKPFFATERSASAEDTSEITGIGSPIKLKSKQVRKKKGKRKINKIHGNSVSLSAAILSAKEPINALLSTKSSKVMLKLVSFTILYLVFNLALQIILKAMRTYY